MPDAPAAESKITRVDYDAEGLVSLVELQTPAGVRVAKGFPVEADLTPVDAAAEIALPGVDMAGVKPARAYVDDTGRIRRVEYDCSQRINPGA